jgi:hypothetical protein
VSPRRPGSCREVRRAQRTNQPGLQLRGRLVQEGGVTMTTIASPIFPSPMAGTCTRRRRLDGRADDRDRALSGAIILGFIWLIRDGPSAGSSRLRTRRWPSSTAASPRAPSPSTTTTSAETSSRVWQRGALIQAQLAAIEGPSGDEDAPLLIGAAVRRRGLRASPPPTARAAGMRLLRRPPLGTAVTRK